MKHIAIIMRVYVKKEYRGQGVGKKLFELLMIELKSDNSIVKINLDVTTTQLAAIHLYENFGFKKVGMLKQEYFVDGQFYDVYEMEKYLS